MSATTRCVLGLITTSEFGTTETAVAPPPRPAVNSTTEAMTTHALMTASAIASGRLLPPCRAGAAGSAGSGSSEVTCTTRTGCDNPFSHQPGRGKPNPLHAASEMNDRLAGQHLARQGQCAQSRRQVQRTPAIPALRWHRFARVQTHTNTKRRRWFARRRAAKTVLKLDRSPKRLPVQTQTHTTPHRLATPPTRPRARAPSP